MVNARCKYGWTPLYTTVHHGSYESMLLLLEMGADVNLATNLGKVILRCYFAIHIHCDYGILRFCITVTTSCGGREE